MKIKNLILSAVLTLAASLGVAEAQTNVAPVFPAAPSNTLTEAMLNPLIPLDTPVLSILTNIPTATFDAEKFGITVATVMQGSGSAFESSLAGEYILHTNFLIGAEIQSGTGAQTVDKVRGFFGIREAWPNYEIFAHIGGGRDWVSGHWEGIGEFGASYKMTGSIACTALETLVVSDDNSRPNNETKVGFKLAF